MINDTDKNLDVLEEGLPIVRFDLLLTPEEVTVKVGGNSIARMLFCAASEDCEKLCEELQEKLREVARWTGETIDRFKNAKCVEFIDNEKEEK